MFLWISGTLRWWVIICAFLPYSCLKINSVSTIVFRLQRYLSLSFSLSLVKDWARELRFIHCVCFLNESHQVAVFLANPFSKVGWDLEKGSWKYVRVLICGSYSTWRCPAQLLYCSLGERGYCNYNRSPPYMVLRGETSKGEEIKEMSTTARGEIVLRLWIKPDVRRWSERMADRDVSAQCGGFCSVLEVMPLLAGFSG